MSLEVQGTHIKEDPEFSSYWGLKNDFLWHVLPLSLAFLLIIYALYSYL